MIDLTTIIVALFGIFAAFLAYKVMPYVKVSTTAEQYAFLLTTTRVLVYAAEQLYGAGKGKEKLEYVKDELEKRGFTIDVDAIESFVRELSIEQTPIVVEPITMPELVYIEPDGTIAKG